LSIVSGLWSRFKATFVSRVKETLTYDDLKDIHQRRFAKSPPERFTQLWCEVANLCEVSPRSIDENSRIDHLGDRRPGPWSDLRFQELEAFIAAESTSRTAPSAQFRTVGDVMDYLLDQP
jgi:hypothetical protein